jgi:hypothetical protein
LGKKIKQVAKRTKQKSTEQTLRIPVSSQQKCKICSYKTWQNKGLRGLDGLLLLVVVTKAYDRGILCRAW